MLEVLRKRQKLIVYIVAVTFILGLAGYGGYMGFLQLFSTRHLLGKVNGTKITQEMFDAKYDELVQNQRAQAEQNNQPFVLTEDTKSQLRDQAWQNMIQDIIIKQQLKKNRIKVSEADIRKAMESQYDLIPSLVQIEALKTNGKFDVNKYYSALNNDEQFARQIYEVFKE